MIDVEFKKYSYFNIFVLLVVFNYKLIVVYMQLFNLFNDLKIFFGYLLFDE